MTARAGETLVAFALLTLLAACQSDSVRWPTAPQAQPAPVAQRVIHFEPIGYPNYWEVVGLVGTTLSDNPFGVLVHDGKSALSGVQVVWSVTGRGGSVTPTNDATKDGRSDATLTLGPEEGLYTVTATAPTLPGAPQITFKGTAVSVLVEVRDLVDGGFVPANVTIPAGRSVGWRYASADEVAHNVVFEDDPTRPVSSGDMWDLWAGVRGHSRLFAGAARTIRYRCTYHSTSFVDGEVGTVTVK